MQQVVNELTLFTEDDHEKQIICSSVNATNDNWHHAVCL